MKTKRATFIIGVAGGSGSGKSWLANFLQRELAGEVALISQDWYYKDRSKVDPKKKAALNFDHPHAFDTALLVRHLDALRSGRAVETPRYDYATHSRSRRSVPLAPAPVIVLEGIFVLHHAPVLRRLDHAIFVDVPADVRLMRRIRRDAAERGLPAEETLRLYETFARPMHERFIQLSAARAHHVWRALDDPRFPKQLTAELKQKLRDDPPN